MKHCAILSMDCLDDFEVYDQLIEAPLAGLGWQVSTVSWRNRNVSWSEFEAVIIRTPWDYQEDPQAFLAVLQEIEQSTAHLENALDIVRWNIDKRYLRELAQLGVKIVPTSWQLARKHVALTTDELSQFFADVNQSQIIIKPTVSANADNTFWLTKDNANTQIDNLNEAFSHRDFMVQPFVDSVVKEGEYSLFYFNGHYSHAILKTPKQGDFRVQEEHGGQLSLVTPEQSLLTAANKTLSAIKQLFQTPLYARVDFVRFDNDFALMEAELIEPSLYFNMDKQSASRFAHAFVERMQHLAL
ncbi:ATP-grasp domain-containing protein [Thalassotalea ganghwensis]